MALDLTNSDVRNALVEANRARAKAHHIIYDNIITDANPQEAVMKLSELFRNQTNGGEDSDLEAISAALNFEDIADAAVKAMSKVRENVTTLWASGTRDAPSVRDIFSGLITWSDRLFGFNLYRNQLTRELADVTSGQKYATAAANFDSNYAEALAAYA